MAYYRDDKKFIQFENTKKLVENEMDEHSSRSMLRC